MAKRPEFKFDAAKPFHAYVGAAETAVEAVRKAADDVQAQLVEARTKLADVDRDPKVLAAQARTQVVTGLETLTKDVNERIDLLQKETNKRITAFQTVANKRVDSFQDDLRQLPQQTQTRVAELQAELVALPGKVEERLTELQDELKAFYAKVESQVSELATKGESRVAKLRDSSISGDVEIIRDDAEVVKEVDVDVEAAAAAAAEQVEALKVVEPTPAKKAPARKSSAKKA
jgi:iron-sulfur cluster repair protein YtfE (RIC family)